MKYLVIGTGGTGGCIGAFLAMKNEDVTMIARGETLQAIKRNGLRLKVGDKEIVPASLKVASAEEYKEKADVIFVCVKSYSIDGIAPIIEGASHENTIVIPTMNGFRIGDKIAKTLNKDNTAVLDGCIYISAYIDAPGSIVKLGNIFKIVFGPRKWTTVDAQLLSEVKDSLCSCGIDAYLSDNIEKDTFVKYSFISAYATCAAYYGVPAKELQPGGKYRGTFIELCDEIKHVGEKLGLGIDFDLTETNLKALDSFSPETTTSLQKDMKAGKQTEIDGLICEVLRMSNEVGVFSPLYNKIAKHFGF